MSSKAAAPFPRLASALAPATRQPSCHASGQFSSRSTNGVLRPGLSRRELGAVVTTAALQFAPAATAYDVMPEVSSQSAELEKKRKARVAWAHLRLSCITDWRPLRRLLENIRQASALVCDEIASWQEPTFICAALNSFKTSNRTGIHAHLML